MVGKATIAFGLACVTTSALAQNVVKFEPFPLRSVTLRPGCVADVQNSAIELLKSIDPNRLLNGFYAAAGLKPKAAPYQALQDADLEAAMLGTYLTAASQVVAANGDPKLKANIETVIAGLADCQKNLSSGYLGTTPDADKAWTEIRSGDIDASPQALNGMYVPWKVNAKILSGLIDCYNLADNDKALAVATKFGDWTLEQTRRLTDDLWQSMLVCDYGNMAEALENLTKTVRNTKYRDLAKKFYDRTSFDPLANATDRLDGLDVYAMTQKATALSVLFESTSNPQNAKTAKYYWYSVVKHHAYATGGFGYDGLFNAPDQLSNHLSTETCDLAAASEMFRLTSHLFQWDSRSEFIDYEERLLFNQFLPSWDTQNSSVSDLIPMRSGHYRSYQSILDQPSWGRLAALETATNLASNIYYHLANQRLYVCHFVPNDLTWLGQTVRLDTNFPKDEKATLTIAKGLPHTYEIAFRKPKWLAAPMTILVNGKAVTTTSSNGFAIVKRQWRAGDKVQLTMPMSIAPLPTPGDSNRIAYTYGPLVLAGDLGPITSPRPRTPVMLDGDPPIVKADSLLTFKTNGAQPQDVTLHPLIDLGDRRTATYFEHLTAQEWAQADQAYQTDANQQKELDSRTLDRVTLGDEKSEQAHKVGGQQTDTATINERSFRRVLTEGFLDLELKSDPKLPLQIVVTYWGDERAHPDFTVIANGQQLAVERLAGYPLNRYYQVTYKVPEETSATTQIIKVQFLAAPTKIGPCVGEVRSVYARG
ncbi:MAG: glycoside hydrolase family 127 protein [Armatimonadetes bacterium]|nr:glycoside hydrolase family 127 protein [Armatimonadota bacterium]